jgi:EAL domain-containing protein (putative c-di-GMP-specific phosphodiesterase class I)
MSSSVKAGRFGRIRGFVRGKGVRIVFQPITDLHTGRVVGYESLARFDGTPAQSTAAWFDDATAAGLRRDLELSTARTAVASFADVPGDAYLTVNVSPDVAMDPEFIASIPESIGSRLVIEITEHTPIDDYDTFNGALAILRARGVRLAIDDAGAGFANMTHILRISPDLIKLDIELTRHVDIDSRRRALVRSLVEFARSVGATLVAEGIETAAELDALRSLGVDSGQGYHLGYPAPLHENAATAPPVDEGARGVPARLFLAISDFRSFRRSRREGRNTPRSIIRPIALALIGSLLIMPTAMAVADGANPGTAGYWLKRTIESVRLIVAFDRATQARLHLDFAERRINELSEMIADGRSDLAPMILADYRKQIDAVSKALGRGARVTPGLRDRIEKDVADYVAILGTQESLLCKPGSNPQGSCDPTRAALRNSKGALALIQRDLGKAPSKEKAKTPKRDPAAKPTVKPSPAPVGKVVKPPAAHAPAQKVANAVHRPTHP